MRTESTLDENKIYFSHILSPFKKKQQLKQNYNYNYYNCNHNYVDDYGGKQGTGTNEKEDVYQDIDVKAGDYVKKKHQKFELSKLISMHSK